MVQADESAAQTVRMTFTATGNNTCVWGSKRENYNAFADIVEPVTIDEGKYTLRSVNSGLYISEKDGNVIQSASQAWNIKSVGNGEYSVIDDSGNALTVVNGSSEDGANICQWEFWGGDGQKFILEPFKEPEYIKCDVNADKQFNVADLVMMQKFLLGNGSLTDWKAGDLCEDDRIDVFDSPFYFLPEYRRI